MGDYAPVAERRVVSTVEVGRNQGKACTGLPSEPCAVGCERTTKAQTQMENVLQSIQF